MKRTKSMMYQPSVASNDLMLYAVNNKTLHAQRIAPMVKNLARYYNKGKFDSEKAIDGFYSIATDAAKMYCHEFGDGNQIFTVTDRFTVAVEMLNYFMENIEANDY